MHAEQGEVEERLRDEIAIAHRVDGVLEPAGEAQVGRHTVGVERQRRACERARAERRHVEAAPSVEQAVDVARQRPRVGEQMMGERHRLGPLHVRVARQLDVGGHRRLGPIVQDLLQLDDPAGDLEQGALGEQPHVGGDLVVAAASGVELGPGRTRQLGDPPLDRGVHVLVTRTELEGALGELLLHAVERGQHDADLVVGHHPGALEAAHVGARAREVVGCESEVEAEARGEGDELLGRLGTEPALPQRHWRSSRRRGSPLRAWRAAQVSTPRPQSRTKPSEWSWRKRSAAS